MTALNHQFEPDLSSRVSSNDTGNEGAIVLSSHWLDRQPVQRKLSIALLGNSLILVFLVTLILSASFYFSETGRYHSISNTAEARSNNAVIALYEVVDGLETAQGSSSQAVRSRELSSANATIEKAIDLFGEPILEAKGDLPAEYGATYIRLHEQLKLHQADLKSVGNAPEAIGDLRVEVEETQAEILALTGLLRSSIKRSTQELFANISTVLLILALVSAICVLGSILGARAIAARVSMKISQLTDAMGKIISGDTSLEIPSRECSDEIGDMARALEVFRRSSLELSELHEKRASEIEDQLRRQKISAEEMRVLKLEKSQLLENLADGFEVSVGELITSVSAASEQLKATSSQMVNVAAGSNDQADNASAAMKNASTNVTAAAAATDEFALSIHEISQQASASASLARDATDLVASANTRMDGLSSAAEEVGEIAGLIQTIAQRTNLLALNASIEAARGGEAGRGFAVVASEVKELAMQTSAATRSVADKISAMQESTKSSAGDLTSIYNQIGELEKVAVVIATAVDQQSVSGEELARNIDTVAEGSRQVSERLVALREASEETGTAAGDVVASANALGQHASDLREKAGRFIADVRRSARELETNETAG